MRVQFDVPHVAAHFVGASSTPQGQQDEQKSDGSEAKAAQDLAGISEVVNNSLDKRCESVGAEENGESREGQEYEDVGQGLGLYGDNDGDDDGDGLFDRAAVFPGATWNGSPFV